MNLVTQAQCYDIIGGKEFFQPKNIELLERDLLTLPQVSCPVTHKFGPGIYMRQVFLPKGSIVIGHHHNEEHMNIFLKGKITFFKDDGQAIEMEAPMTFVGKPGRKIAYIHENSIWVNVWATNETDVEKLEEKYLTKSDSWQKDLSARSKIDLLASEVNKKDFSLVMKENGWTEEKIKFVPDDIAPLPFGDYKIKTGKSTIQGTGLFATGDIEPEEIIAPAKIGDRPTMAGRFANHSLFPNAKVIRAPNGAIFLVASKKIEGCLGGRDGEEITINYREALDLTLEVMEAKCRL